MTTAESAPPNARDEQLKERWLIKGPDVGGAEQLMSTRKRDQRRSRPTVASLLPVTSDRAGPLRDEDVERHCFDGRSSRNVRWLFALRRLLQTGRFDVIHVHSPLMAVGARLAVKSVPRRDRPRMIVTEHNVWRSHTRLTRFSDRLTAGPREVRLAVSAVLDSAPGVDIATAPDQEGRGIFRRLTLAAIADLQREGVDFVFNTPNDTSRPGYLQMGWTQVGRLPAAARVMGPAGARRMRARYVPIPRRGPTLTWRPLADPSSPPQLRDLELSLGDVELL